MAKQSQFEVLLDVRESQRDGLQAVLAEALSELERRRAFVRRKQAALQEAKEELDALHDEREALMQGASFQPRQLTNLDRHADVIEERIEQHAASVERARKSVEEQSEECDRVRGELNEAQKSLEAVRKHYQRQLDAQELTQKRKRQAQSDEIASRRWWEDNQ